MPLDHYSEEEYRDAREVAEEAAQVRESFRAAFSGPGELALAYLSELCLRHRDPLGLVFNPKGVSAISMDGATMSERAVAERARRMLFTHIEDIIGDHS